MPKALNILFEKIAALCSTSSPSEIEPSNSYYITNSSSRVPKINLPKSQANANLVEFLGYISDETNFKSLKEASNIRTL
jgi:hypothetical protein